MIAKAFTNTGMLEAAKHIIVAVIDFVASNGIIAMKVISKASRSEPSKWC